jgi:hypothetical protein
VPSITTHSADTLAPCIPTVWSGAVCVVNGDTCLSVAFCCQCLRARVDGALEFRRSSSQRMETLTLIGALYFVLFACGGGAACGTCRKRRELQMRKTLVGTIHRQDHLLYGRRWEDNIKMDFIVLGCESVKGFELARFRVLWWRGTAAILNMWMGTSWLLREHHVARTG